MPRKSEVARHLSGPGRPQQRAATTRQDVRQAYRESFPLYASRELRVRTKPPNPRLVRLYPFLPPQAVFFEAAEKQRREIGFIRQIWLKARQVGGSTLSLGLLFALASLNKYTNTFTSAHDTETAQELFKTVHLFYDCLSPAMKPKIRHSTKKRLSFEDVDDPDAGLRSSMVVDTAKNIHLAVGRTLSAMHFSEVARYDPTMRGTLAISATLGAVPLAAGTIIIMESTAFVTGAWFKDQCARAQRGEGAWRFVFVPWFKSPEYRRMLAPGEVLRLNTEERGLVRRHGLTPRQIKFMRMKIAEFRGDENQFKENFPSCLTSEVRVSTEGGIIPIAEAIKCEWTESGKILKGGPQVPSEVYRLVTTGGRTIRGTHDHPVKLVEGTFRPLSLLHPGDQVALKSLRFADNEYVIIWRDPPGVEHRIRITAECARFLGYFLGDGCLSGNELSIACNLADRDVVQDVEQCWAAMFAHTYHEHCKLPRARCIVVRASHATFGKYLERLGAVRLREGGGWGRTYRVPECIWRSPKPIVREFLRGLFESDGSASGNCVSWCTAKLDFARDVQLLLLGFGIDARINKWGARVRATGRVHPAFGLKLGIEGSIQFHERIGFVGKRKSSLIPRRRQAPYRKGGRWARIAMQDTVQSIARDGLEITYDLTVSPDHEFAANGIITHNTPDEAWITLGSSIFPAADRRKLALHLRNPVQTYEIIPPKHILPVTDGPLWVWEPPQPGVEYDLAIDVAMERREKEKEEEDEEGPSDERAAKPEEPQNFSAIEVVKRGALEQVAEWKGQVDPFALSEIAACLGYWYNMAQIAPEAMGIGIATAAHLSTVLQYPNLYRWRYRDRVVPKLTPYIGWETRHKSKQYMVAFGLSVVRTRDEKVPLIHSTRLYEEIEAYVRVGPDQYGAAAGHFDDLISAWLIALVTSNDEDYSRFTEGQEDHQEEVQETFYEPGKAPRVSGADPAYTDMDASEFSLLGGAVETDGW